MRTIFRFLLILATLLGAGFLVAGASCHSERPRQHPPLDDRGGKRPITDAINWENMEKRMLHLLRRSEDLRQSAEELEQAHRDAEQRYQQTRGGGLPWFNAKDRARREADSLFRRLDATRHEAAIAAEDLKDALAATPASAKRPARQALEANSEIVELAHAIENVNVYVERSARRLRSDASNTDLAIEHFEHHVNLLGHVQAMHASFLERTKKGGVYRERAQTLWKAWLSHESAIRDQLAETESNEIRTVLQKELTRTETVLEAMPRVVAGIDEMASWTASTLDDVRDRKSAVDLLLRGVQNVQDSAALVDMLNMDFESLAFEPPPIVDFDLPADMLELHLPKGDDRDA